MIVGDLKGDIEDTFLDVIQLQESGQKQGPHFRNRGPDRMALSAEHIPKNDGISRMGVVGIANLLRSLFENRFAAARLEHAAQIPFHIGQKDGHAEARESLRQGLEGDGFASAGGPRNQPVPVGVLWQEVDRRFA